MAKFCVNCGTALNPTTVFCGGCGTKAPTSPAPVVSPVSSPAAFSPAPSSTPNPSGYEPAASAWGASPANTPAAPAASPEPVRGLDSSGYEPVASAWSASPAGNPTAPANPVPNPVSADFQSIPSASSPAPVSSGQSFGYEAVPASAAPAFTAPAAPAPPPASPGYGSVPAYSSAPAAPPSPVGYAPVAGVSGPPPVAYGQNPAAFAPPAYGPAQGMVAGAAYPVAKKSNTLLKIVVGLVIVLFVGGALALAGLYYAAKKIKAKAEEATSKVLRDNPSAAGGLAGLLSAAASDRSAGGQTADGVTGDPCRFLSKEEVSQAVGVTVIRADAQDGGCSYIAKGDPADVTAKHTSALMGEMGVDAKSQKQVEKIAGAFFAQQEAGDKDLSAEAAKGEIPVLGLSFTSGNAALEMKMNRGAFAHVRGGPTFGQGDAPAAKRDTGDLTGIGDDAIVIAGSMILVRKGNVVAHFMFASCPCSTSAITPLTRLVASRL